MVVMQYLNKFMDTTVTLKMWIRRVFLTSLFFVLASGCGYYQSTTIEKGRSIDQSAVNQIIIGKTTRSDVFNLLGTPHSIFQDQVEFVNAEYFDFYLHVENRYLSSIDDKHYAMLYRFGKSSGISIGGSVVLLSYGNTRIKIKADELLLLVNRENNIVDDVAYRKEIAK